MWPFSSTPKEQPAPPPAPKPALTVPEGSTINPLDGSIVPVQRPRPSYAVETTGSTIGDLQEATKRLSVNDFQHIGEIPCARNSLLAGIASGAGMGVIRGMTAGVFVASNWAVGCFMLVSLGSWHICQRKIENEKRKMQTIIESMPARRAVKHEDDGKPA
ncbi:unnamed protein product [Peniophora sp. CBMAI 1063]|nr:unnamed protein product [Peniophora sp. CBMAI 1063]